MSIASLYQTVRYECEGKFFLSRIHGSVQAIRHEKGRLAGAAAVGALTVSSVAGAIFCWLCLEGSVRSVIDVIEDPRSIVRLRYLGDVGGWTSLALFSVLAVKTIFERVMAEGEYCSVKEICLQWCLDNRHIIEQSPELMEGLYQKLYELIGALQARCLFSKGVLSKHIVALDVYKASGLEETSSQLIVDRKLETLFKNIQAEVDIELSAKKYCCSWSAGQKKVKQKSCSAIAAARIFGIAFPLIFMVNFVLSIVGEVGLGKELFVDREELTDIGHFGEWPINAIESLGTAYLLIWWYSLSVGSFEAIKGVFSRCVAALKDDEPILHDRVLALAKEELAQVALHSNYLELPDDTELDDLTDRFANL